MDQMALIEQFNRNSQEINDLIERNNQNVGVDFSSLRSFSATDEQVNLNLMSNNSSSQ